EMDPARPGAQRRAPARGLRADPGLPSGADGTQGRSDGDGFRTGRQAIMTASVKRAAPLHRLAVFGIAIGAALSPPPHPAAASRLRVDSPGSSRTEVAVTAYNNNLALVREVRSLEGLPQGEFDLNFLDVPSLINPRTVALRSLSRGGGLTVLEQNYEY